MSLIFQTIGEYLDDAKAIINRLNQKYKQETIEQVDSLHRPDVFNAAMQLRTVLEYHFHDIVTSVVAPTLTAIPDLKLAKKLKQNIYFPYSASDQAAFDDSPIVSRLKTTDYVLYMLIESCQPYRDQGAIIEALCEFVNPVKHEHPNQQKISTKSLLLGTPNNSVPSLNIGWNINVIFEGPATHDGILVQNSSRVKLFNHAAPKIEIKGSKQVIIHDCNFNCLISDDSDVLLYNNTILGRPQEHEITIKKLNYTAFPPINKSLLGLVKFYDPINRSQPCSIIEQSQFVVTGTDLRIIGLLNDAYLRILTLSRAVAAHRGIPFVL